MPTPPAPPGPASLADRAAGPGKADASSVIHSIAPAPRLAEFLGGEETRIRDLLAFGMAAEAGVPPGPDGIAALRRKAEAELQAHAYRLLHNQVETIRRQAMDEQLARGPRGLSFNQAVAANLVALVLAGALAVLGWLASPLLHGR